MVKIMVKGKSTFTVTRQKLMALKPGDSLLTTNGSWKVKNAAELHNSRGVKICLIAPKAEGQSACVYWSGEDFRTSSGKPIEDLSLHLIGMTQLTHK